jgi:peptide subunit release factor 1 (eRF1)
MGFVTEDALRTLAAFKGTEAPVVSVYLDVDGRRYPRRQEYEAALTRLLHPRQVSNDGSVAVDLHRIESHVRAGFDRSQTRGLALFACSAHGFWEVIPLAVPVRNQCVVNHTAHIRQLEAILHNNERFGVLVVDRQRARAFVFEQGELVDHSEQFDRLPRHDDDHGDWDRDHLRDHTAAMAHAHVRRAGQVAFALHQERPLDHLILSAPNELIGELERGLHAYLRERIVARVTLPAAASPSRIRAAAFEVDAKVERAKAAAVVERLRDRLGAGSGAVAGLEGTLAALNERRVETLLVSEGFVAPGWRCRDLDHLAVKGRRCATCGGEMIQTDDVVEDAVEVALGQSCRLLTCTANADLDVAGRIGALLRF